MSDTALAELRTIIAVPRTLREMTSSPIHEINKREISEQVSNEAHTKLPRPISSFHMDLTARKVQQIPKDWDSFGVRWKR